MSERLRHLAPWIGAVAITVAAGALVHDHTRMDSASFDEPSHIHAAYLQVFHRSAISNMEHPPLAKEIAGLGLLFVRPSDTPMAPDLNFPASAHRFLFENRVSPDSLLAAARAPMLLFFAALCLLVFGAARRWFGTLAGFFALLLTAFEPNLLAHAGIVHTDVPVSLFWLASILAWGRVLERRSAARIVVAGVLLGLALATKFSALYLLPTFALAAMAVRALDVREPGSPSRIARFGRLLLADIAALAGAAVVAVGVALLVYQTVVAGFTVNDQQAVIRRMVGVYERAPALADRLAAISSFSKAAAHLAAGIALVGRQNAIGGGITFLDGRMSMRGFPGYFFEAFAFKTGLPFLVSAIAALVALGFRRIDRRDAILWVAAAYYFAFSIGSSYNIGIRHVLPVYPILAVAVSRLVRFAGPPSSPVMPVRGHWRIAAVLALAVLQGGTAALAHPHELSYFNVLGGGMANGYRHLADSNTDWGLDLRRLTEDLSRRNVRDATICYFGGDRVYPRAGIPDFAADPRVHGDLVAISTTLWDIGPAFYAVNGRMDLARSLAGLIRLLRERGELVGRIGGSTLIYRPPSPSALERLPSVSGLERLPRVSAVNRVPSDSVLGRLPPGPPDSDILRR